MAKLIAIAVIAIWISTSGCGVKKEVHQKALDDLAATQSKLNDTEKKLSEAQKRLRSLERDLESTQASTSALEKEKEARIAKLLTDIDTTKAELLELRKRQEKAEERLNAFRELNSRFRALVDTGKLKVDFRNGQMVLKLPSEVLFDSGQGELSTTGKTALAEVLEILKEFKDRRFLIGGHTDNVAIRSRKYKNNWYLSTARAVSVVEFMIEAGFSPNNLAAAGYGEFDPVVANDTDENRRLNRRIEIVLIPDLSELPNLVVEPSS